MRKPTERVWHTIKPNETTRQPRHHIILDTESRTTKKVRRGTQTWRLAVACYVKGRKGYANKEETREYKETLTLWRDVSDFAAREGRTVVWAHNLGHDVRISRVFTDLPNLGWSLVAHSITARSTWLEWRRDKATILMVDSVAFFPTTIAQIGEWFRLGQQRVDLGSDSDRDWFARARRDVEILTTAVTAYLDWIERGDLGNWQCTGPGQSWAVYRHKFLTHKLTVHDDIDALAAERRAMWTGRCEAYWHGEIRNERIYELDFRRSYPTIARDYAVPIKLLGPMPAGYDWKSMLGSERTALLARVRVTTSKPVVPTERGGRILWPVGTFRTTLWDCEIRAALNAGATIEVERGWLYRKAPALKAWGEWIIGELDKPDDVVPAWQKAVLKHWSRALIGRLSMSYRQWDEWGTANDVAVTRSTLYDSTTGTMSELMQIGTTVWQDMGRADWQHSMPMITGYIQAIGRVQLWEVLDGIPAHTTVYVDTDSILCTRAALDTILAVARRATKGDLRLKRAWDGFAIFGPRQVVTGDQVRISGIPRTSQKVGRRSFEGEVWESLIGAMRRGTIDAVVTTDRRWEVKGVDYRRSSNGFGWTEPIEVHDEFEPMGAQPGGPASPPVGSSTIAASTNVVGDDSPTPIQGQAFDPRTAFKRVRGKAHG